MEQPEAEARDRLVEFREREDSGGERKFPRRHHVLYTRYQNCRRWVNRSGPNAFQAEASLHQQVAAIYQPRPTPRALVHFPVTIEAVFRKPIERKRPPHRYQSSATW